MTAQPAENSRSALKAWVRALERTAQIEGNNLLTFPVLIDSLAERYGDAAALASRTSQLTYRSLAALSNRYARWGLTHGLGQGDVVGLLMQNCPDYIAIWLGLTRIGIVASLLNTSLTGELLAHSINVVRPVHIIVSSRFSDALRVARDRISPSIRCWAHETTDPDWPSLNTEIVGFSSERLSAAECPLPTLEQRALFIYTSGTTGLPKAAIVSHFRIMQWAHWFAGLMDTRPADRMYNCLPLFHSVGGVVATGATLVGGGTVILRERFSASDFWQDIATEECTLFQYIGELCRYLTNSPFHVAETAHRLRLCCGNGLRSDVWNEFKNRFRIPDILEYYAATEGSFSLYNCEGRPGAIGRIPPFLRHRNPVALVKFNETTASPMRLDNGHCVQCEPNEVGEAIGEVRNSKGRQSGRFEGYADADASQKKLLQSVFAAGDAWYRTGDLMRQDEQGYFYFVDRIGDTFRWKGENVSTTEVAVVIDACRGVSAAAVYGVAVPGTDGRAGMAALVVGHDFDLAFLRQHLTAKLPEYSRPLFIRIVPEIEITSTFKLNKQLLARQGYDPASVGDTLYFDDRQTGAFVRMDAALYERLQSGQIRT
jgi:fatty-acyl-CoA synthase